MQASVQQALEILSLEDLVTLHTTLAAMIKEMKKTQRQELLQKYRELAASSGLSLEEVLGGQAAKKSLPAKYRNPDNPGQAWSGRGLKPIWLQEKLAQGKTLDDFKV